MFSFFSLLDGVNLFQDQNGSATCFFKHIVYVCICKRRNKINRHLHCNYHFYWFPFFFIYCRTSNKAFFTHWDECFFSFVVVHSTKHFCGNFKLCDQSLIPASALGLYVLPCCACWPFVKWFMALCFFILIYFGEENSLAGKQCVTLWAESKIMSNVCIDTKWWTGLISGLEPDTRLLLASHCFLCHFGNEWEWMKKRGRNNILSVKNEKNIMHMMKCAHISCAQSCWNCHLNDVLEVSQKVTSAVTCYCWPISFHHVKRVVWW